MLKKILSLAALGLSLYAGAQDTVSLSNPHLAPEERHSQICGGVTALLSGNAYHKLEINDELSKNLYKEYLKDIDFSRSFLLQEDIDRFKENELTLDDRLMEGDVRFAFEVYNTFLKRADDRVHFVYGLLKDSMDFSSNDSFAVDRENAAWCKSKAELDKLWTDKIKYECLGMLAGGKDWKATVDVVRKRYENYEKQLKKTKSEDVFDIYMNSFTTLFDPHTEYFSPRIAADFSINSSLSLEGIGATLQTEGEYTKIRELVKGGPADKSGKVQVNDRITAVAQGDTGEFVDVIGWRIDDVVALIRGKKGTVVRLKIIDAKAAATDPQKTVRLVRDKIKLEEQASKGEIQEMKRGGKTYKIGVIKVPSFYLDYEGANRGEKDYKSTTRDVKNILDSLKKQGIDGLVMDIRNNGGGALLEAVNLTGLFIKDGPVVEVKDLDGSVEIQKDKDPTEYYTGPLVVLVNRFSASASEIFSAAIQDYNRGIIVGEQTHGKGTVQNLIDLNRFISVPGKNAGELKLTISKFYRVNGNSTQIKGVIPDVALPSLYAGKEYGEDDSPYALPYDQIEGTNYQKLQDISDMRKTLVEKHDKRMKDNAAYKFLLEDIKEYEKAKQKEFVTTNYNTYKAETEANEKRKKERDAAIEKLEKEGKYQKDLILHEGMEVLLDIKATKT